MLPRHSQTSRGGQVNKRRLWCFFVSGMRRSTLPVGVLHQPISYEQQLHQQFQQLQEQQQQIRLLVEQRRGNRSPPFPMHAAPHSYLHHPPAFTCMLQLSQSISHQSLTMRIPHFLPSSRNPMCTRPAVSKKFFLCGHYPSECKKQTKLAYACTSSVKLPPMSASPPIRITFTWCTGTQTRAANARVKTQSRNVPVRRERLQQAGSVSSHARNAFFALNLRLGRGKHVHFIGCQRLKADELRRA